MTDNRTRNNALLRFLLLPTIFLTVALLGGVRISAETRALVFVAPPLVALVLALMLLVLFARGGAIRFGRWLSADTPVLVNVSHALTLAALFFASAQSFNSVLPDGGLLRWMLSFFFLWTLWQNQFAAFDARRLLRSLAALFGTAFVLKHVVFASLYAPDGGWLKRLAGGILEGITLGALDGQSFAPATGYVSFFTLALYVGGLALLPPAPEDEPERATETPTPTAADEFARAFAGLPPAERESVRAALLDAAADDDERTLVETKRRGDVRRLAD